MFLIVAGVIIAAVVGMKKTDTASSTTTNPASVAVGEGLPVYTLVEVAKHASAKDCWTTINGNVYDLTSFVGKHPGGEAILKVCGVDGTSLFMDQHGGQAKQENQLAGLEIGVLAK